MHLAPSYGGGMDSDFLNNRHDNYGPGPGYGLDPSLGGPSGGMNDISALAAAASDQLYELERHEAFRRAEYELRHRQIASTRSKSNGGSPVGTPGGNPAFSAQAQQGAGYGFSNERDRWGSMAAPAQMGGQYPQNAGGNAGGGGGHFVYPISAGQPATATHPAVPPGTLADPTYLVPPSCCHEDCHKSYRKRLKVARQTQACPNCLTLTHGGGMVGGPGGGGGGGGGGPGGGGGSGNDSHRSSNSNTPKDRSAHNSNEDLHGLGQGGNVNGNGNMGNSYNLHHHQQNLHQQLVRLQQQHAAALGNGANAHLGRPNMGMYGHAVGLGHGPSHSSSSFGQNRPAPYHHPAAHQIRGAMSVPASADHSRAPSVVSDDSSDDESHPSTKGFEFTPATSPVLSSMKSMSLFPGQAGHHGHHHPRASTTAPTSIATSPIHSRNASRASSPVEGGHHASSGKHGATSHSARDAKHRSQPYHNHHHHSTPNSPRISATKHAHAASGRMSPPKMSSSNNKSVEDILNASLNPPHSTRTLPPPNSSYPLQSAPGSTQTSPAGSRSTSPVPGSRGSQATPNLHHLAHSVRAAFGMTPIRNGRADSTPSTPNDTVSPPNRLAPLGGSRPENYARGGLPSFSRGNSPVYNAHRDAGAMEVDGQA